MKRLLLIAGALLFAPLAQAQQANQYVRTTNGGAFAPVQPNNPIPVNVVAGGGAGGTSSNFGAGFPGTGTAAGVSFGGNMVAMTADASSNLNVNCVVGCSGGTSNNNADGVATSATNGQTIAWLYGYNGATFDRLRVDGSKNLMVNIGAGTVAATQSGAWTVTQSGTWNLTNISGTISLPTGAATGVSQGSTTSGQTGTLAQGAVTTAAPSYTTAQTSPLSLDTSGGLRVNCATGCSGGTSSNASDGVATSSTNGQTLAWLYGYNGTTFDRLQVDASKFLKVTIAASAASNISMNVAQINGVTPLMGNGVTGTGSQRVTIASDNTAFTVNAAQSGTWNITNVSGTVSLPTGASTAANQTAEQGSPSGGTAATVSVLGGGIYNSSPLTLTNGQQSGLQFDANGYLKINVATGGGSGGTASSFAAAFPSQGTAIGAKNGANMVNLTADGSNNLNVNCAVGCSGGTFNNNADGVATSSTNGQTAAWLYAWNGSTWDRLTDDGSKRLIVSVGAVTATNISTNVAQVNGVTTLAGTGAVGTGSIRVAVGTDTATIAGSAPGTAGSASANVVTVQGVASMTPVQVSQATASNLNAQVVGAAASGASKAGNPVQMGCVFNTTQPTVTTGQAVECQATARGGQIVATGVDTFNVTVATALPAGTNVIGVVGNTQGSTTSGQSGPLIQGAVTTAAPSYTTAQTSPLSLDTSGALRVNITTAGVSNLSTNIAQINGTTPLMGNGVTGTGSLRVTIASDNTANSNPWLVAGAAASGASKAGNPVQTGGVFNTTQPTVTNGQAVENQATARGAQIVATGVDTFNVTVSTALPAGTAVIGVVGNTQGSTTSGQSGPLIQGAVTTAAPSYTTAQTSPLSLDTSGALRVNLTTAGVSNLSTNIAQINGTTPLMGNGVTGTGSLRVTIASDNTANSNPWLVAGAAASGASKAGNPVQVGHVFNTTQPTVTTGQAVEAQATARGGLIVATGVDTFNATINAALPAGTNLIGVVGNAQASTTSGQSGPLIQGAVTSAVPSYTTAQTDPLSLDLAGNLRTTTLPTTVGGLSFSGVIVPNNTTSVALKAAAGQLYSISGYSISAATPAYIKFYNTAQGSVTCGSGTPLLRFMIPGQGTGGSGMIFSDVNGLAFSTALTYCITAGIADADTTSPAASTYIVNFGYK